MASAAIITPAVFLSASVPDPRRDPLYYATADIASIREAVVALATAVLPQGMLVFGGHPAISPLVLLVAKKVHATDRVRIYQSQHFRGSVPSESLAFPSIIWTPEVSGDRGQSLTKMREEMIAAHPLRAGVFIGGMEGVEAEYAIFRARHPTLPRYAIASTGAAARIVFDADPGHPSDPAIRTSLEQDLVYDALFHSLPEIC